VTVSDVVAPATNRFRRLRVAQPEVRLIEVQIEVFQFLEFVGMLSSNH
jgi:hypothetical protein